MYLSIYLSLSLYIYIYKKYSEHVHGRPFCPSPGGYSG